MPVIPDSARNRSPGALVIGLVNNMPDAALEATERQFHHLLDEASGETPVLLKLFSLSEVPRGEMGRQRLAALYADGAAMPQSRLDALIVTGAEPFTADLRDEAYWPQLVRLLQWAETHTHSSLWSCLAAHAAVLHLAGVHRHLLTRKCSGVFAANKADIHPLTDGFADGIHVPHSRYNGLSEDELAGAGFTPLTHSPEAGADIFSKETDHLFLFVQGHPEYEERTLLREYRRDIGRFLRGEREFYPDMPLNYFDAATTGALLRFREAAHANRHEETLAHLPVVARLEKPWRPFAVHLYRNWLSRIAARKQAEQRTASAATR